MKATCPCGATLEIPIAEPSPAMPRDIAEAYWSDLIERWWAHHSRCQKTESSEAGRAEKCGTCPDCPTCPYCGGDGYYKGPRLGDEGCPRCNGHGVLNHDWTARPPSVPRHLIHGSGLAPRADGRTAACPDGLTPDGPVCPRCGGKRGPSGVDGGSWVHYPPAPAAEQLYTYPEATQRQQPDRDGRNLVIAKSDGTRKPVAPAAAKAPEPETTCPFCGGAMTLGVCTYWRCHDIRKATTASATPPVPAEAKEAPGGTGPGDGELNRVYWAAAGAAMTQAAGRRALYNAGRSSRDAEVTQLRQRAEVAESRLAERDAEIAALRRFVEYVRSSRLADVHDARAIRGRLEELEAEIAKGSNVPR